MTMSAPILIGLWAPPGVGKSRTMAGLFAILKNRGHPTEMSPEVAKWESYRENRKALADPFYILGLQEFQNFSVKGKVDYIVTDYPVGMCGVYSSKEDLPTVRALAMHVRARYRCFDVRLTRDPGRHFETYGRHHTEEESLALEFNVDRELTCCATGEWFTTRADAGAAARIVDWLDQEEFNYGHR